MTLKKIISASLMICALGAPAAAEDAAELERKKALQEPYANDFGPNKLTASELKEYSEAGRKGYRALVSKCTACHNAARPLHSQFFEPKGKTLAERKANLEKLRKTDPDMFAKENRLIWQPEAKIWQRYVKRMMSKPGCEVGKSEGKLIWKFLVEDSHRRKHGKKKGAWRTFRKKLLADFKKKHPKRYKELYEHK